MKRHMDFRIGKDYFIGLYALVGFGWLVSGLVWVWPLCGCWVIFRVPLRCHSMHRPSTLLVLFLPTGCAEDRHQTQGTTGNKLCGATRGNGRTAFFIAWRPINGCWISLEAPGISLEVRIGPTKCVTWL